MRRTQVGAGVVSAIALACAMWLGGPPAARGDEGAATSTPGLAGSAATSTPGVARPVPRPDLTDPEEILAEADRLHDLGGTAYAEDRFEDALPAFEQAVALLERVIPEHPITGFAISDLALCKWELGDLDAAEAGLLEALAIQRAADEDSGVAGCLQNLATLHATRGEFAIATPMLEEAVALFEGILPASDPRRIVLHLNLGDLAGEAGRVEDAYAHVQRAQAIAGVALAADHPMHGDVLINLALWARERGAFEEALALTAQARAHYAEVLGADSLDYSRATLDLGGLELDAGRPHVAMRLAEEAVERFLAAVGEDHLETARARARLGQTLLVNGRYVAAEAAIARALPILSRAHGPRSPERIMGLVQLCGARRAVGRRAEAEEALEAAEAAVAGLPLSHRLHGVVRRERCETLLESGHYEEAAQLAKQAFEGAPRDQDRLFAAGFLRQRAQAAYALGRPDVARRHVEAMIRMVEAAAGPYHPSLDAALHSLATYLSTVGLDAEAVVALERSCEVARHNGARTAGTISGLCRLAELHVLMGRADRAEPVLREAEALARRASGEEGKSSDLINAMARMYVELGDDAKALEHYRMQLIELERRLPPDHPQIRDALFDLGSLVSLREGAANGAPLLRRCLALQQAAGDPAQALTHAELGLTLCALGELEEGLRYLREAYETSSAHALGRLMHVPRRERAARLRDVRMSLVLWAMHRQDPAEVYSEMLRWRRLDSHLLAIERRAARTGGQEHRQAQTALEILERHVSRLGSSPPDDPESFVVWQVEYVNALEARDAAAAEAHRALRESDLTRQRLALSVAQVRAALGPGDVLVEVGSGTDRWVAAWIVTRDAPVRYVAIGPYDDVAKQVEAVRLSLLGGGDATAAIAALGASLAPMLEALPPDATRLYWSPASALTKVSLRAVPHPAGGTVGARYELARVTSGADLIPSGEDEPLGVGLLAVGGVDYQGRSDGPGLRPGLTGAPDSVPELASAAPPSAWMGALRGGEQFTPLPATLAEVRAIAARSQVPARERTVLVGHLATERALRESVAGKRVVHLATHGIVRPDRRSVANAAQLGTAASLRLATADPFLQAGLAFAGASTGYGGGDDDGLLTALEVTALPLEQAELVVLSACDTAGGTLVEGEGIVGLLSAFQVAGARDVVASLWPVDDRATSLLMDAFYRLRFGEEGLTSAAALQRASRELREYEEVRLDAAASLMAGRPIERRVRPYALPRYWAAFVIYTRR